MGAQTACRPSPAALRGLSSGRNQNRVSTFLVHISSNPYHSTEPKSERRQGRRRTHRTCLPARRGRHRGRQQPLRRLAAVRRRAGQRHRLLRAGRLVPPPGPAGAGGAVRSALARTRLHAAADARPLPQMKRLPCLLIAVVVAGCASSAFKPSVVGAAGTPYQGLNENSYGPRSATQFRFCDPQDDLSAQQNLTPDGRARFAEFAHGVAASTMQVVGKPLQGLTKVDTTLVTLGLDGAFRSPADSDHPAVAVLSRAGDRIHAWHAANPVRPPQVTAAAQVYCARRQRATLYRGSASRCPAPQRGLSGLPVVHTYAISATPASGAERLLQACRGGLGAG